MKKAETKDRLKEALEIREMKQSELVEKTGIDKGQMSSYLNGRYKPKQNNLHLIAEALSVDEAWLMGYDVPMRRSNFKKVSDGGDHNKPSYSVQLYGHEEQDLIIDYRKLSSLGKAEATKRVHELTLISKYVDDIIPLTDKSYLEPLAAHHRTDINKDEITEEMKQHDMNIMNNDDFWK